MNMRTSKILGVAKELIGFGGDIIDMIREGKIDRVDRVLPPDLQSTLARARQEMRASARYDD